MVRIAPGSAVAVAVQFVVEAVGATPTVTLKVQGSLDGSNWSDMAFLPADSDTIATTKTVTAVGATIVYLAQAHTRFLKQIRLVTSANTNVTYRGELYHVLGR